MPEERKLVTVLFADIVDSTALAAGAQPEVVRDILSRAFVRFREILERHGGTVEKFIGDEVMAVFGAPATHEDDAARAVRAAFALQEARGQLTLRIGLNTGEVVAASGASDQFLVSGEPVIVAARLRAAAKPGEILVGPATKTLTTPGVRYGRRRAVQAKGLGKIEAWPAEGLDLALPETRRGVAGLRSRMVGRDEELQVLLGAHRRVAHEGRPNLVTVFGSAGAGKSRLLREFVDGIGAEHVMRGRCLPYGEGITYWPVQEVLRQVGGISAEDSRDEVRSKLRAAS